MKILFDARWWSRGPYSNAQVMKEFVRSWQRLYDDDITLAIPKGDLSRLTGELPSGVRVQATRLPTQGLSAMVELPVIARRLGSDITFTHNFTPLWGTSAVFVHDVLFISNPEWFTNAERWYLSAISRTLPRADFVFTSSRSEAKRIANLARPRASVEAVGLGVPPGLLNASGERPDHLPIPSSYLLIVGRLNIRKNLVAALRGALASGHVHKGRPAVVVGEPSGRRDILPHDLAQAVAKGEVLFTGFITDKALNWLYTNADLFMFLSLDEGFGIPCLEALELGTPILASDIEVFREILRDAATYVDPTDVAAIGAEVSALLQDRNEVQPQPVAELGYSWDLSVKRVRATIAAGLASGPRRAIAR